MWLPFLLACTEGAPFDARSAWLQEELTADNAWWLTRSPGLVEGKYTRMAEDPYDWMRGSASLFLSDQLRPDPDRSPTTFLTEPDAASVLLVGDPHVENLGTCLPGEEPDTGEVADAPLVLEWVDLDAAAFGPWTLDTRRAALALSLLVEPLDCDALDCDEVAVVTAFATAYAGEIEARTSGSGWDAGAETEADGALVAALRAKAREEGAAAEALADYSVVDGDHRVLLLDDAVDDGGKGLLALRPWEAAQLARLLDGWTLGRPEGFRVLDAARLYGKGVASFPAVRFLVLWDSGGDGPEDDRLLNIREVSDPPSVDGVLAGIGSLYRDNAERIAMVPARVWSRPDADARMGSVADGADAFKSTTTSGWFDTFDHEDVVEAFTAGEATEQDLEGLAAVMGRALASAHARGTTLDGAPALDVIAADLRAGGGSAALVDERLRDAPGDLAALYADHDRFRALLADAGPLLGADALY